VAEPTTSEAVFDFATFDTDVRIQDDLFRHVNGIWLDNTEIPDDKPTTGAFVELRDRAEEAVRDHHRDRARASRAAGR
jgi:putative endopeptidase